MLPGQLLLHLADPCPGRTAEVMTGSVAALHCIVTCMHINAASRFQSVPVIGYQSKAVAGAQCRGSILMATSWASCDCPFCRRLCPSGKPASVWGPLLLPSCQHPRRRLRLLRCSATRSMSLRLHWLQPNALRATHDLSGGMALQRITTMLLSRAVCSKRRHRLE